MKLKNKIIVFFFITISCLVLYNVNSYASTKVNSLTYDIRINENGDANVVENWIVDSKKDDILYKEFDNSNNTSIYSLNILKIQNNIETFLIQAQEESEEYQKFDEYEEPEDNYFYIKKNEDGNSRVFWKLTEKEGIDSQTFKIYYTISNILNVYADYSDIKLPLWCSRNKLNVKNISGTIKLPKNVSSTDKILVKGHGELKNKLSVTSTDTIEFNVSKLSSGKFLDARITVSEKIFDEYSIESDEKFLDKSEKSSILNAVQLSKFNFSKKMVALVEINILVLLFFIFRIKKCIKRGKKIISNYGYKKYDLKYFEKIPDEKNLTPSRAEYLINFNSKNKIDIRKIFTATLLDLANKNLIEFETIDFRNIRINLKSKNAKLSDDENIIFDILLDSMENRETITSDELKKYAKVKYTYFKKLPQLMNNINKVYVVEAGKVDYGRKKTLKNLQRNHNSYLFLLVTSIIIFPLTLFCPALTISLLICSIITKNNVKKMNVLTENGYRESIELNAYKRYLEDCYFNSEKEMDVEVLEKNIIYATMFGCHKKVIKHLRSTFPKLFYDENKDYYIYSSGSERKGYWDLVCDNDFANSGIDVLNNCVDDLFDIALSSYTSNDKKKHTKK